MMMKKRVSYGLVLGVFLCCLMGCARQEKTAEAGVRESIVSATVSDLETSQEAGDISEKGEQNLAKMSDKESANQRQTAVAEEQKPQIEEEEREIPNSSQKINDIQGGNGDKNQNNKQDNNRQDNNQEKGKGKNVNKNQKQEEQNSSAGSKQTEETKAVENKAVETKVVENKAEESKAQSEVPQHKAEPTVHKHKWVTETKEATCTAAGEIRTICSECGEVQSVSTGEPAKGHRIIESWFGPKPTCDTRGYLNLRCEVCGYIEFSGNVPELEHVRDDGVTLCEGNCSAKTVKEYKCRLCGEFLEYVEWYEPDIHDWVEAVGERWNEETQEVETVTYISCSRCSILKEE